MAVKQVGQFSGKRPVAIPPHGPVERIADALERIAAQPRQRVVVVGIVGDANKAQLHELRETLQRALDGDDV